MNDSEKMAEVPQLKDEGNSLYREKKYSEASELYARAIGILETLMTRYTLCRIAPTLSWCHECNWWIYYLCLTLSAELLSWLRRPSSVRLSVSKLKLLRNCCMDPDQILWEATYPPYLTIYTVFFFFFKFSIFKFLRFFFCFR